MSKKMLIDATHPEETRVVVSENGRVEELDVDTSTKKQIKGNIYLAKIVRVEPSLQAAFVDYGGNKHGFLAFNEIHPDYYQLPVADREALKEMMKKNQESEDEIFSHTQDKTETTESDVEIISEPDDSIHHRPHFLRRYKIQEVIRQGQVMLVQAVKEERGNKGAALTTYLSLAGRFSVLMPNNAKGGGVSRKITNAKDRKALRTILDKFSIPEGMSVIVRTAGQGKTKTEIKRDYDYLIKTWMKIREETLVSLAPKLIHEEGDIIKRSLRDVFTPDIDEIWVEGEKVFKSTKDFMKILMPAQAKKIKQYKGTEPLFVSEQIESQLESIHSNIVQLKSGGYLVIDQTEALVAVDVNSGRATREHDIEETALRTNLETCDELARQLRLRDMAGLIVIDFIDMDEPKNNAAIERRLKEALKKDRARIQVGKMSGFGLMEMSRQRLHSSFLESSYQPCVHCGGKGLIRSVESCAMHALHILEEASFKNTKNKILISLPPHVATYLLNVKRTHLVQLEDKYNVQIQIIPDTNLVRQSDYKLERIREDGERYTVILQNNAKQETKEQNKEKNKQNDSNQQKDKKSNKQNKEKEVSNETENSENEENKTSKSEKRNKNKRRNDWKKRRREKRMLERLRQAENNSSEQKNEPSNTEEKFTVVEQTSIQEFDSKQSEPSTTEEKKQQKPKKEKKPVVEKQETSEKKEVKNKKPKNKKDQKPKKEEKPVVQTQTTGEKEKTKKEEKKTKEKKIKKEEKSVIEKQKTEKTVDEKQNAETQETPTDSKKKKKGWWNKIVK